MIEIANVTPSVFPIACTLRVSMREFAYVSMGAVAALCVHIFLAACHFETCESETCCACVTGRPVATGGG